MTKLNLIVTILSKLVATQNILQLGVMDLNLDQMDSIRH